MKLQLLFIVALALGSCAKKSARVYDKSPADSNTVQFSEEQLQMAEIKWSKLQKREISDIIECNGIIEIPPQNNMTVSPVLGGNVKEINILPGMYVQKGQKLATLYHPDYLHLQEEYFEATNRYLFQKEEYKRQGELTLEQATSLKKMQSTEADFKILEARVFSLKKQLEMLGIDPVKLKPEDISPEVEIKSPLEGYVTQIFTNRGKYIAAGEKLCQIIDKSHLHVQLNIFERDISYLKQGQKINFSPAAIPDKNFTATVELIGQAFTDENHSIPVHAHISPVENELKPGMFVTAKIKANPRVVYALPLTSVVRKNNDFFVYVFNNKKFTRTKIKAGKELDQYIEVLHSDSALLNSMFVTRGAYYLESEWEKTME